ncbi:MAG: toll/interleukin-1 receptor domain-containing protein [Terricaulis sp.]
MADVFLSYAREDRARAEQVALGLNAVGLEVFWDSEIPPGTTWADYIEQKLAQCKALIVLWSEHSAKSQWVREEARLGRDKGVLIPAMLDATPAPFGFGEVQGADLSAWGGEQEHADWRRFVEAVRAASQRQAPPRPQPGMSAPPRAQAIPMQAAPTQPAAARSGPPVWVWVTGAVVATVVLLGVIGMMMEQGAAPGPATQQAAYAPPLQQQQSPQPPPPAGAQPQNVILMQLQQAQMALSQQGFQVVGQPFSGSLAQGQTWNVPAELYMGVEYRVLGVCDADCGDLDLIMYDGAGAMLTQDTTVTSQPMVALRPGYNGNHVIQVQMYNCSTAPCYYALALYGRRVG